MRFFPWGAKRASLMSERGDVAVVIITPSEEPNGGGPHRCRPRAEISRLIIEERGGVSIRNSEGRMTKDERMTKSE
jgi:hypothetical protein